VSEHIILYVAGGVLATITAVRLILQELTTVVVLYKRLIATIKTELPVGPHESLDQSDSSRELSSSGP
jgi:hypothetical protein